MGDKSPKSKARGQKQKADVKKQDASKARVKQERAQTPLAPAKKK